MDCIFCRIISRNEQAWIVYEDDYHLACLTPFPNTPGFTVLMPKEHHPSDVLNLEEEVYSQLLSAAKKVAGLLNSKLHTKRCGLIIEGMGVDHAHIKLIPMYGIADGDWRPVLSSKAEYSETYQGYLTTHDGPRMSNAELDEIREKIIN